MLKYHRLNEAMPNGGVVTEEEDCALLHDDHYSGLHERSHRVHVGNGVVQNVASNTTDIVDSTIEVPLLLSSNNSHINHITEPAHSVCQCKQPGFTASILNKSTQDAKCKIFMAMSLCCVFMIFEFIGGFLAGSLSIISDAAHLASDCVSFIIGLVAILLGNKPPDGRMSFGYKRMEVIGALVSILSIWILTGMLVATALQRIYYMDFDLDANIMLPISATGIVINIIMMYILHRDSMALPLLGHGHSHGGEVGGGGGSIGHADSAGSMVERSECNGDLKHSHGSNCSTDKNLNLRAATIHVIGDLVQSVGVFLSSVLIKIYPSAKFMDPICTLFFSVIVIVTTTRLFIDSIAILIDAVPRGVCLAKLERDLGCLDGVKSVHHLNVWQHTSNYSVLMVHLVVDLYGDTNTILQKATQLAVGRPYDIKHCTIQIERRLTS